MSEPITARVLYRDGLMIVLDKPAGVAVHRGPKGGASLEDAFDALRFGLPQPPALAHRLDRETSGCLVLGRHRKALALLGALFKHGKVRKTYWAVVEGGPEAEEGRIDLALGRRDASRGWWMKPDPNGQPAQTLWRVIGQSRASGSEPEPMPLASNDAAFRAAGAQPERVGWRSAASPRFTWLALTPLTGRTHQLRVHCAAMGWPIVGDAIYGNAPRNGAAALHLHAVAVVVPLYPKREPIQVTAPVPPHMGERLKGCGWQEPHAGMNGLSKESP